MAKHPVKALPYANDALKGIGAKTIEIHHDKLYAGYVNKRNEIEDELAKVDRSKGEPDLQPDARSQARGDLRGERQILHEIYFNTMGGDGQPAVKVFDKIKEDFGSYATWRRTSRPPACARADGWCSRTIPRTDVCTISSVTRRTRAACGAPFRSFPATPTSTPISSITAATGSPTSRPS